MTLERWREVEELFKACSSSSCSSSGRVAELLAQAKPEVREEVEALLAQQRSNGPLDRSALDFLNTGSGETVDDGSVPPSGTKPPTA